MTDINNLKTKLHEFAYQLLTDKINENKEAITVLKESVGNETKSSAGDKHETARAMMHLEQEKVMKQLAVNQKVLSVVNRVDPEQENTTIGLGSLVITDRICFYIIAGIGQIHLEEQNYYMVSFQSEIVQAFKGKKKGDTILFKNQSYSVKEVL